MVINSKFHLSTEVVTKEKIPNPITEWNKYSKPIRVINSLINKYFILLFMLIFPALVASSLQAAPVSYDNSAFAVLNPWEGGTGNTLCVNIDVTSNNGMLLVELCKDPAVNGPVGNASVSSVTYDDIAMQFVTSVADSDNPIEVDIYALANPPDGNYPVCVTLTANDFVIMDVVSYNNVGQIGAISVNHVYLDSYLSTTITTTTPGSWIAGIAGVRANDNIATMSSDWIPRLNVTMNGDRTGLSFDQPAASPGTYFPNVTNDYYSEWQALVIAAVELEPSDIQVPPDSTTTITITISPTITVTETLTLTPSYTATLVSGPTPCFITKWGSSGTGNGQFSVPEGIAVSGIGNVYVTDFLNDRIEEFSGTGAYITQWGNQGNNNGQFVHPLGVAIDSSGDVYVADSNNNRIQEFSSTGAYITQFGMQGPDAGMFHSPSGIAIDSSGDVYVADSGNNRIQEFSSTGTYITQFGSSYYGSGTGNGQFNHPEGVAIDSSGNVFVTDSWNNRVEEFSSTGAYITQWGSSGTSPGQFSTPIGIAIDRSGNIYIADVGNNRIQEFSNTGVYMTQWGSYGTGNGFFDWPYVVAADSSGDVYVADDNDKVQEFGVCGSPTITPVVSLTITVTLTPTDTATLVPGPTPCLIMQWGSSGNGNGQFYNPYGIALNSSGDVYVTDDSNDRIEEFSSTGAYMNQWGVLGNGNGQFHGPFGVAVSGSGNVYIADTYNNRIQEFSSTGTYITQWGSNGSGNGQFNLPYGVAVDSSGNVYVTDEGNNRIEEYGVCASPTPTLPVTPSITQTISITATASCTPVVTGTATPTSTCSFPSSYDTDTIAAYEFENNGNDSSGNGYNLIPVNGGGSYQTSPVKYGSYSYYNSLTNNSYDLFPAALETRLAALSSFAIEFWVYIPVQTPCVHSLIPVVRGTAEGQPNVIMLQINNSSNWNDWGGALINFKIGATEIFITMSYPSVGWHHFSIDWTGTVYNLYMDSTIAGYINSTANVFASGSGNTFGLSSYFGNTEGDYGIPAGSGLDRLIISDIARGGHETLPSGCYGPTNTATYTRTPTYTNTTSPISTYTQTAAFTMSPTNINTNTDTATSTITEAFTETPTYTTTPTYTNTASQTSTYTQTATFTISPTYTITDTGTAIPTMTATLTQTLTYTITPTDTNTPALTFTASITPTSTISPTITITPTYYYGSGIIIYPNPYNPGKAVDGTLKFINVPINANIFIYTISGEIVISLAAQAPDVFWNGRNSYNSPVSPGIYYYVIKLGSSNILEIGKIFVVH